MSASEIVDKHALVRIGCHSAALRIVNAIEAAGEHQQSVPIGADEGLDCLAHGIFQEIREPGIELRKMSRPWEQEE